MKSGIAVFIGVNEGKAAVGGIGVAAGHDVTGFDLADTVGGITDPEISQCVIDLVGKEFPLHLGAPVECHRRLADEWRDRF